MEKNSNGMVIRFNIGDRISFCGQEIVLGETSADMLNTILGLRADSLEGYLSQKVWLKDVMSDTHEYLGKDVIEEVERINRVSVC